MDVPSLYNICFDIVVRHWDCGIYLNHDYILSAVSSQHIFDTIYRPNHPLPPHTTKEIEKKFDIKNVVLGRNNFDENHYKMVYSRNLERLEILNLKDAEKSHYCHISTIFENLIGPESRRTLRTLKVFGADLRTNAGWVLKMCRLVPFLTTLHMNVGDVNNDDFRHICLFYQNLTELSIRHTGINDLTGIRLLKNLKVLSVAGLEFDEEDCVSEIRELTYLEVLDISSDVGSSTTAKLLAECEGSLQNLKFMDCAGNSLKDETLRSLFKKHPRLANVSVLNTELDRTWDFSGIKVEAKFFSIFDLRACNDSLNLYKDNSTRCKIILKRILHFFEDEYDIQPHDDIRNCASLLCTILMSYRQNDENKVIAFECLKEIFKEYRVDMFTDYDRICVAKTACFVVNTSEWVNEDAETPGSFQVARAGINLFDRTLFARGFSPDDIWYMCSNVIMKLVGPDTELLESCCSVIMSHSNLHPCTEHGQVVEVNAIQSHILALMKDLHFEEKTDTEYIQKGLVMLFCSAPWNDSINEQYIDIFLANMFKKEKTDYEFHFISSIMMYMKNETRMRIFRKSNFDTIVKLLRDENCNNNRSSAITFLFTEYKLITDGSKRARPFDRVELNELGCDVVYWVLELRSGMRMFEFFDTIARQTKFWIVASWANWVYNCLRKYYK